jgi:AcrR family transcriptional regulator
MYQRVHNVDSAAEIPSEIPRRLPRGTHGLDPSLVAASQRTRLLEAVGRAVAEKGYAAATIDDIVRDAGVSKKTFYEHFSDKLDCFLAAYEAASDELLAHVTAAQDGVGVATGGGSPATGGGSRGAAPDSDWLARTRAGIHAYLRWLAAEPALARVFLIEIAAAGPEALERRERLRDRYAERMRELQPENGVPDEIFHAAVAAADDLVVRRLRAGADLRALEETLLRMQLALLG